MSSNPETRQRLTAVIAGAFVTGLALAAITMLLPLHATQNLGLSSAQFARVLSLRMAGITLGVILLSLLLSAAFSVVAAFAAIRLSNELGLPAARYGEVCGLASALSLGAAFSVHKVLSAAYIGVATLAFGLLEPALGINRLFIGCAAVGGVRWAACSGRACRLSGANICQRREKRRRHGIAGSREADSL